MVLVLVLFLLFDIDMNTVYLDLLIYFVIIFLVAKQVELDRVDSMSSVAGW